MDIGTFLSVKELLFSREHPGFAGGLLYPGVRDRLFKVTDFIMLNSDRSDFQDLWLSELSERVAQYAEVIERPDYIEAAPRTAVPFFSTEEFDAWVKSRARAATISGSPNQVAARAIAIALVVEYMRLGMHVSAAALDLIRQDIENYELLETIRPLIDGDLIKTVHLGSQLKEQILIARNDYLSLSTTAKEELNHIEAMRHEARKQVEILLESTGKQIGEIEERTANINFLVDASRTETAELSQKIIVTGENIKAFTSAVREELKVDGTRKLWAKRAKQHRTAFWISTFVIAGGLIVPPYCGFTHVESVLAFLQHVGAAVNESAVSNPSDSQIFAGAVSRLVIVSIPIALYFWALKLAIRFNQRALALADDAEQRGTMMDTYFHLIEQQGASSEERALILNALFRPLAGAQSEHVEPPNFIDLLPRPK